MPKRIATPDAIGMKQSRWGLAKAEIAKLRQVGARKDKRERAGTSPAPTTLNTQLNNQVVAGFIPAWGGGSGAGPQAPGTAQ